MSLLELFFQFYFALFLIRLLVPDTGQVAFNSFFQFAVRVTRPVLMFLGKALPARARKFSPLIALLLLIFLQGLLYQGSSGSEGSLSLVLERWQFQVQYGFWGPAKSLAFYLYFLYELFLFLLLLNVVSPLRDSSDQLSRLVRSLVEPFRRLGKNRLGAILIMMAAFSLTLTLLWRAYGAMGLLKVPERILARSLFCSLAVIPRLITIFAYLIIARVLLSWLARAGTAGWTLGWLESSTEPFLRLFRGLGLRVGAWDLSPLVAVFSLFVLQQVLLVFLSGLHHLVLEG